MLALAANPGDVSVGWIEGSDVWVRNVPASASADSPKQVSTSANASKLRVAWNPADNTLGAVWMGTTLSVATIGASLTAHGVYSDNDPLAPDMKEPLYAVIAQRPSTPGWGIVWDAIANNANRLFGLITDAQGVNQTQKGTDTYTRITDATSCPKRNMALVATTTGFAAAWADNVGHCEDGGTAWEPDIYVTTLGADLGTPLTDAPIAAANGVSDFPALAFNGSELGVAWVDDREAGPRVWFARAAGAGAVPGSELRLSDDAPNPDRPPSIAAYAGGYGVSWQSGQTVHFVSLDAQGQKTRDLVLTSSAEPQESPSVIWAGSQWVVAWVGTVNSAQQLELSTCAP